jgi:acyl-coenzyme A synthetase/AMP-(fatty) acid ligase
MFFIDEKAAKILTYDDFSELVCSTPSKSIISFNGDISKFIIELISSILSGIDVTIIDGENNNISEVSSPDSIDPKTNTTHLSPQQIIDKLTLSISNLSIYTSGTTGKPKKITHSNLFFVNSARTGSKYLNNIWGYCYNPSHMAGLQVLYQSILNKNLLINLYKFNKENIYDLIEKYNITNLSATPTFYRLLFPIITQLNSVQKITLGGEASDTSLLFKLSKLFPNSKINNIYASSEGGTLLVGRDNSFTIPNGKSQFFKIIDNELFIHKSQLGNFSGNADEWYPTGDLVERTENDFNYFKIIGRKSIIANIGGEKVNPFEVESIINSHDSVLNSRVYSKVNSVMGNILVAEIILNDNRNLSEHELKKYLQENGLQNFKIPRVIYFKNELSTTINRDF